MVRWQGVRGDMLGAHATPERAVPVEPADLEAYLLMLPPAERERLGHFLLESVGADAGPLVPLTDEEWEEILRRVEEELAAEGRECVEG